MAYGGFLSEVSNRASWIDVVEVTDLEDGSPIDLTQAQEIVVQVVSRIYDNYYRYDYGFGVGGYTGAWQIIATLSGGKIVLIQPGMFQFSFTRSEMNTLPGGDYDVGMTITIDDITTEIFIGQVPIREGIVTIQAGAA
jgi:hypothetical protein